MSQRDVLSRLARTLERRRSADPQVSYTAALFAAGEDAILKKIAEEAAETLLAAKDGDKLHIVHELADLWFHCVVLLAHHGISPDEVLAELARRECVSGIDEKKARKLEVPYMEKENCIFCKIVRGEIPSKKIYEDDDVLAFHDIQPVAPVHFMLIPKRHVDSLAHVDESHQPVLGKIMALAGRLAREQGATEGFRTIVNTGRIARQDVAHLHLHVIGGDKVLPRMLAEDKE